jgi:single-strand DNA-binding protein
MASFNKITIVGYLGKDPEIRYLPDGTAVCQFSVATTEKRKNRQTDEVEESTTWFRIAAWGRQGEACNQYLTKGSQVYVEGSLRQQEYTDRDGNKRTWLEVRATDVQFVGSRGGAGGGQVEGSQQQSQARSESPQSSGRAASTSQGFDEDNEIPF